MTAVARMTVLHLRTVAPYRTQGLLVFGVIVLIDSRSLVGLLPALALLLAPLVAAQPFLVADKADLQTLYAVLPLSRRTVLLGHYAWALMSFFAIVITGTALAALLAQAQHMAFGGRSLATLLTLSWALFAVNISIQLPLLIRFGYTRISVLATTVPLALVMLAVIRVHLDLESIQDWLPLFWAAGAAAIATSAALASCASSQRQRS
ncbi:ABC-2 transporter permease [Dactylosporangium sp. NPDC048998]|uniref:ABC-2 transporter permease n=1 Tax=Dactylosporangium sp. NPDC048998 TaxID=3363976 RepID=UPI00371195F6